MSVLQASMLSPRLRKLTAVSLLVVALAAIWGGLVRPLLQWTDDCVERLAEARFSLARMRNVAQADKALSASTVARSESEVMPWLLSGSNESDAAARLQAAVDGMLRSQSMTVEATQGVPPAALGSVTRLGIDVRMTGDEVSAIRSIASLERARPLLKIERITVRTLETGVPNPQQPVTSRVAVEMRVAGYWLAPTPVPSLTLKRPASPDGR
jgi:hypothetical protein